MSGENCYACSSQMANPAELNMALEPVNSGSSSESSPDVNIYDHCGQILRLLGDSFYWMTCGRKLQLIADKFYCVQILLRLTLQDAMPYSPI
uniref:Uncharacterized protein n=1 Tax=Octopus bimaculoides TaxID=37653 RepID=A0A0L8HHP9_OCTBM